MKRLIGIIVVVIAATSQPAAHAAGQADQASAADSFLAPFDEGATLGVQIEGIAPESSRAQAVGTSGVEVPSDEFDPRSELSQKRWDARVTNGTIDAGGIRTSVTGTPVAPTNNGSTETVTFSAPVYFDLELATNWSVRYDNKWLYYGDGLGLDDLGYGETTSYVTHKRHLGERVGSENGFLQTPDNEGDIPDARCSPSSQPSWAPSVQPPGYGADGDPTYITMAYWGERMTIHSQRLNAFEPSDAYDRGKTYYEYFKSDLVEELNASDSLLELASGITVTVDWSNALEQWPQTVGNDDVTYTLKSSASSAAGVRAPNPSVGVISPDWAEVEEQLGDEDRLDYVAYLHNTGEYNFVDDSFTGGYGFAQYPSLDTINEKRVEISSIVGVPDLPFSDEYWSVGSNYYDEYDEYWSGGDDPNDQYVAFRSALRGEREHSRRYDDVGLSGLSYSSIDASHSGNTTTVELSGANVAPGVTVEVLDASWLFGESWDLLDGTTYKSFGGEACEQSYPMNMFLFNATALVRVVAEVEFTADYEMTVLTAGVGVAPGVEAFGGAAGTPWVTIITVVALAAVVTVAGLGVYFVATHKPKPPAYRGEKPPLEPEGREPPEIDEQTDLLVF